MSPLSFMPLRISSAWASRSTKAAVVLSFISDDKYQLRHAIYEQFTNILYAMHMEKNGSGLIEGNEVKLEEGILPEQMEAYHIEGYRPSAAQDENDEDHRYE